MAQETIFYELTANDLSHLGGPMGTEYTTISLRRNFNSKQEAKAFAANHYGKPIKWIKQTPNKDYSGDLRYIDYTITKQTVR